MKVTSNLLLTLIKIWDELFHQCALCTLFCSARVFYFFLWRLWLSSFSWDLAETSRFVILCKKKVRGKKVKKVSSGFQLTVYSRRYCLLLRSLCAIGNFTTITKSNFIFPLSKPIPYLRVLVKYNINPLITLSVMIKWHQQLYLN